MTQKRQSQVTPSYQEKPGANPFIIFIIFFIFVLLPIGIFAYIATNSPDFFSGIQEFITSVTNGENNEEPTASTKNSRGLKQDESINSIESINEENPDKGIRTVGNSVAGYIDVPIDWTEFELSTSYPLQSFSFENGTSAIYVTTLDPEYKNADEAISILEESLKADKKIQDISQVQAGFFKGSYYYFARVITYFDSTSGYYQRDFIFCNNDRKLIYISIASPENTKELDYILESYREDLN